MIDFEKLRKSLKHLELQFQNYKRAQTRSGLSELDREAIAESVVQRFETCYDTLWKNLRRTLDEKLGLADVPSSPKPVIKLAGQNNLLPSSVDQWLNYADARTATAHDYSEEKATKAISVVGDFINDAISLYQTMSGKPWE